MLAGLDLGVGASAGAGQGMGVAVGGGRCVAKAMGQGVGVAVGLSFNCGNGVGRTVGTRVWKATGVTNMGSGGSGVGPCSTVQPVAVNNRIDEIAKHPALNRLISTTGEGSPFF